MHGLRENRTGNFYWITQPSKPKEEYHEFYETSPVMDKLSPIVRSQIKCCAHKDDCDSFIMQVSNVECNVCVFFKKNHLKIVKLNNVHNFHNFQGIRKYLKLGMGLEMARFIIYNYNSIFRNPLTVVNRLNWNLVLFLVGYVGIYRVSEKLIGLFVRMKIIKMFLIKFINCWSNRRNIYLSDGVSKRDNQLASFLCGLVFYLYPDHAIFSHAAITTIEIYWTLYYEKIKSLLNWIPLDKIKMVHVVFPIVFGYALHIRAFKPWLAPAILKKLMHFSTNYK